MESTRSVDLCAVGSYRGEVATARIGFAKDTVVVEALQGKGLARGVLAKLKRRGFFWHKALLGTIEERARVLGYKRVVIRRPETLFYYHYPVSTIPLTVREQAQIEKRARYLAAHPKAELAKKEFLPDLGYDSPEKALSKMRAVWDPVSKITYFLSCVRAKSNTQQEMRALYHFAAKESGYVQKGAFYVKEL